MIRNFKHKGLERFFDTGSVKGISKRIKARLAYLNIAKSVEDLPTQWNAIRFIKNGKAIMQFGSMLNGELYFVLKMVIFAMWITCSIIDRRNNDTGK